MRSNNIPSASAKSAREAIDYQRSNIRQKEEFLGSDQNILKSIIYHGIQCYLFIAIFNKHSEQHISERNTR